MWLSFMLTVTSRFTVHSYAMQPVQIELDNSPLKANLQITAHLLIKNQIRVLATYQRWDIEKLWGLCLQFPVCWQELTGWFGSRVGNMWPPQFWRKTTWKCIVLPCLHCCWFKMRRIKAGGMVQEIDFLLAVKFTMAGSCTGWLKAVILLAAGSTSYHILHCNKPFWQLTDFYRVLLCCSHRTGCSGICTAPTS